MRVITNEQHIKRNKQLAQILFFVSLAILLGGLVFTNTLAIANDLLLLVPCIVMPLGLVTTMISVRLTNQYVRPPFPADAIREGIKGINRRSVLFSYVLPAQHVLVTPQGVYTFTVRFQEARIKVEGNEWYNWKARGPIAPLLIFLRQEGLGKPFEQAARDAQTAQAIVDKALPGTTIKVQPVVVFTGQKTELEVIDPALPVVYADPKRKPSLKGLLREEKQKEDMPNLSDEQILKIEDTILETMPPDQVEKQLIEEEI